MNLFAAAKVIQKQTDLATFLDHVAKGEQDQAKKMLEKDPRLTFAKKEMFQTYQIENFVK